MCEWESKPLILMRSCILPIVEFIAEMLDSPSRQVVPLAIGLDVCQQLFLLVLSDEFLVQVKAVYVQLRRVRRCIFAAIMCNLTVKTSEYIQDEMG